MNKLLLRIQKKMEPFLQSKFFDLLFGLTMAAAPIGFGIQLYKIFIASSVEGVSIETYIIFIIMHSIAACYGIKILDWRIVLAFIISVTESIAIIFLLITKGGTFLG